MSAPTDHAGRELEHISHGFYKVSDKEAVLLAKGVGKPLPRHGMELRVELFDGRLAWLTRTPYQHHVDAPARGWVWSVSGLSGTRRGPLPFLRTQTNPGKDLTAKLTKELAAAEKNRGKYIRRDGIDYARGAYNLDQGIEEKRDWAAEWRRTVLERATGRPITERKIRAAVSRDYHGLYIRDYRVFSADGQDIVAVFAKGGSRELSRLIVIERGTAEEALKKRDFSITGS